MQRAWGGSALSASWLFKACAVVSIYFSGFGANSPNEMLLGGGDCMLAPRLARHTRKSARTCGS